MNNFSLPLSTQNQEIYPQLQTQFTAPPKENKNLPMERPKIEKEIQTLFQNTIPAEVPYFRDNPELYLQSCEEIFLKAEEAAEKDPLRHIQRAFTDGEESFGVEEVERLEVVERFIQIQKKKKESLEKKLKDKQKKLRALKHKEAGLPDLPQQRQTLKKQIKSLKKKIERSDQEIQQATKLDEGWIRSTYFRDLLTKHKSFEKAAEVYISAPVNMRHQSYEDVGFLRLGVISDPRNGWTNFKKLKDILKALRVNDRQLLENQVAALKEERKDYLKKGEMNKVASLDYALEGLRDLKSIDKSVTERRKVLSEQMLQLVIEQVEKNQDKISSQPNGGVFDLIHVGLLNPKNSECDSLGWMHDEANQMLDMAEIFKEFAIDPETGKHKKLIFDGKGPFIDDHGNIHLPSLRCQDVMPQELILDTIFFNVSVQGHNKNDGIQKAINREGMQKLKAKKKDSPHVTNFESIEKLFESGKSNYKIAESLSIALIQANFVISIGCLSAKDRTGVVADRIIIHFFEQRIHQFQQEDPEKLTKAKMEKLLHKYQISLFDPKSPAALIVKDNTGSVIVKCSAFKIPAYSEGLSGKIRRMGYYEEQMKELYSLWKKKKIKKTSHSLADTIEIAA